MTTPLPPETAANEGRKPSLFASSAVMAAGSLVSRILGLLRVIALAALLSTNTRQADMLAAATVIPTLIYFLIAGGALNAILVPQVVKAMHRDADGGRAFTNRVVTLFCVFILGLTLLAMATSPLWLPPYLSDWFGDPKLAAHAQNLQLLTWLTLPQIFFTGLYLIFSQVLNAKESFGPMMWAPVLNNVIYLPVLAYYSYRWPNVSDHSVPFTTEQCLVLGLGATAGILAQFIFLVPFLIKHKIHYRPRFDFKGTGLGSTAHVAKWVVGSAIVTQIVAMLLQRLVFGATVNDSGKGAGGAMINNAFQLYQLPHGLITVSLVTALLPSISAFAAQLKYTELGEATMRLVRLCSTFIVPVTWLLIVMATPLVRFMFDHGAAANRQSQEPLVWTVVAYCLALPLFTVNYVLIRVYIAMERTKVLFFIGVFQDVVQLAAAMVLTKVWTDPNLQAPMVALATVICLAPAVVITYGWLTQHVPNISFGATMSLWLKLTLATVPGCLLAYAAGEIIPYFLPGFMGAFVALVVGGTLWLGAMLIMARAMKLQEVNDLVDVVGARFRRRA